jgi:hypothetical protein
MDGIIESPAAEEPQAPSIDDAAREQGWKPLDEFDGDKNTWIDAREFIGRKPLFDKIHLQNKKLTELEKTLKSTAEHVKKVGEAAYKRAYDDLAKERRYAISQADADRVDAIDAEVAELKKSTDVQIEQGPPAEYQAWVDDNPWFTKDEELFAFACAVYDAQVKKNPKASLDETLSNVKSATKRAYPEKFETEKRAPHSAVEGGRAPSSVKSGPSYSNLNSEQKRVCDNFVRQGIMTKEAYVKSLQEIGEI